MAVCPHCQSDTIGYFAKQASSTGRPVTCSACGGRSWQPSKQTLPGSCALLLLLGFPIFLFRFFVPLYVVLGLALPVRTTAIVLISIIIILGIAHEVILVKRPLVPLSGPEWRRSRRRAMIFPIVLLIFAAAIWAVKLYTEQFAA